MSTAWVAARNATASSFSRYWFGQTVSNTGSAITTFALPLLVFQLTGSAFSLGVMAAIQYVPPVLFGLHAGVIADRVERRRMMIVVDLLRCVLVGTIPLAHVLGILSVGWIFVVAFATSTLSVLFTAGRLAAVPALVGNEGDLAETNGRLTASYYLATLIGPAIGGLALVLIELPTVVAIDAATFAVSALALATIRISFSGQRGARETTVRQEIVEGLLFVLREPKLRALAILGAIVNFGLITVLAQIVLLASTRTSASGSDIAFIFAAGACGAILAALLASRVRRRWPFEAVTAGAIVAYGASTVGLAMAANPIVVAALWAVVLGAISLYNVGATTLRQQVAPPEMLGRIVTVAMVLSYSTGIAGALLGGLILESIDIGLAFAVIGVGTVVVGLSAWWWLGATPSDERHQ